MGTNGFIFSIERFAVHDGPGIRVAIFFKGCPLRCWWCHSPESQSTRPELLIKTDRCLVCGSCLPVCPEHAIVQIYERYETKRGLCRACGTCTDECPTGARTVAGRWITVPDLLAEIDKDRVFIERSGGGVTFSGGEPLLQPEFLGEALAACRAAGIHTAVETSGFGTSHALDIAAAADLVLFDLKILDDERHRQYTGVSNRIILENFVRLTVRHHAVRVRMPLIPGINDDDANLQAIGAFAAVHGVTGIDLLPYHSGGEAKYERLGRAYALSGLAPPSAEAVAAAAGALEARGISVHIGG
jgi:pyruvate formate lyase activating enzyme